MAREEFNEQLTRVVLDALETVDEAGDEWRIFSNTKSLVPRRHTGVPYRGMNLVLLHFHAAASGYANSRWMTFNQAKRYGGHVRKGEHSHPVVLALPMQRMPNGKSVPASKVPESQRNPEDEWMRMDFYNVFNSSQIEDLPKRFYEDTPRKIDEASRNAHFDRVVEALGVKVTHTEQRVTPCYKPRTDEIVMPDPGHFLSLGHYYSTLSHELTHWTGGEKRLNRIETTNKNTPQYAEEELVAQLGATYMLPATGFDEQIPVEHHASYIQSWKRLLSEDNTVVARAARKAQEAFNLVNEMCLAKGLQYGAVAPEVAEAEQVFARGEEAAAELDPPEPERAPRARKRGGRKKPVRATRESPAMEITA